MILKKDLEGNLVNLRPWLKKIENDLICPDCGRKRVVSLYCRDCGNIYLVDEDETGVLGSATMLRDRKR